MTRKLKKREYLGEGYVHQFQNNETGEFLYIPCTLEDYEKLGQKDGHLFNPVLEGYTWTGSAGGTIKVDTENTLLGDNEYCIKDGEVHAVLAGDVIEEKYQKYSLDAVDKKGGLDESKKIEK